MTLVNTVTITRARVIAMITTAMVAFFDSVTFASRVRVITSVSDVGPGLRGRIGPVKRIIALILSSVLATSLAGSPVALASPTQTGTFVRATSQVSTTLVSSMPLLRLHFNHVVRVSQLPALRVSPQIATTWQQIGVFDVQAVARGPVTPTVAYHIALPTVYKCLATCQVVSAHVVTTSVNVNLNYEEQLLAQLNYLPVAFTPLSTTPDPARQVPGYFTWRFPHLPPSFITQWRPGVPGPIVTGALMNFQLDHSLPTTGVVNPATWNTLLKAAHLRQVNPSSYNYVDVQKGHPETLTLYMNGVVRFRALVNTGISVSPTALGTYPVYLRYTSQTMSGTSPDGSHYSDPGIPWVSYFNGGDALHGFIRSTYGWPQSLGCVEMPFAAAGVVWPHTPIGTLVTVRA
jgi:L,D-transpeptidase catalytic domain/Putative peptidoglycan binding domain